MTLLRALVFTGYCRAIVGAALFVALGSALSAAAVSQAALAASCRSAIDDGSILFDQPRVSVADGALSYNPGKIFYPDYAPKPTEPYGFPVAIQFKIELLRRYRADQRAELEFLAPYLARMEGVVAAELTLIANHKGSRDQLIAALSARDGEAWKILDEGIAAWASKNGLRVAEPSFPAAVAPTVVFATVPAGGTVYYLNAVDYSACKAAGKIDELDQWNQVPGPQMDMGGAFYFRAVWPGGKAKQTAKILIEKEETISIAAE